MRQGYTFEKFTLKNSNEAIENGSIYTYTTNIDLYAKWKVKTREVIVYTSDEYKETSTISVTYGKELPNSIMDIAKAHGYDTWDGSHTYDISWMFGQLDKYFLSKGIPVVLTEYGAERRGKGETNNDEQVCYWIKDYLTLAKENGVPTVIWDNGITDGQGERFGLIDRRKLTWDRESVVDTIMQVVYK